MARVDSGTGGSNLQAIVLIILAAFFFAAFDATSKWVVTHGVDPRFAVWVRFVGQTLAAAALFRVWSHPEAWHTERPMMQTVRALCLGITTTLNFLALQTLSLVELIAVLFTAPMVVTALAGPLLGEAVGWRRHVAVAVGAVGMLVIIRPTVGLQIGHIYALCAMFTFAAYSLLTRSMNATETARSLLLWSSAVPAILYLPVVPLYGSIPDDPLVLSILAVFGVIGGIGHFLLILAYGRANISSLTPYLYLQIVWAGGFGWLIFDDLPDRWSLAGSAIIIGSGLYIGWRERQRRQKPAVIRSPTI